MSATIQNTDMNFIDSEARFREVMVLAASAAKRVETEKVDTAEGRANGLALSVIYVKPGEAFVCDNSVTGFYGVYSFTGKSAYRQADECGTATLTAIMEWEEAEKANA